MPNRSDQPLLAALFPDVQIKIWSLVVTVFGDLAAQEHDSLSGAQLKALFAVLSIKHDALRVALHRLSKDGWIISERIGRNSHYRLSKFGLKETNKVWQRVYRPIHDLERQWYIVVLPNSLSSSVSSAIKLATRTYIVDEEFLSEHPQAISFPLPSTAMPTWIGDDIQKDGIGDVAATLLFALDKIPNSVAAASKLRRVAIRVLCIHQWRRIVLRDASLLHLQHFEQGNLRMCHDKIHQLLADIPRDYATKVLSDI